jgi:tRNA(Ile)-lysidine synthase
MRNGSDRDVRPVFICGMHAVRYGLEKRVTEFIRRYGLFAGAGGILLAVSGGADSTALLHLLVSLRAQGILDAELVCAHVNHKLRGPAGEEDERFVVEQATRVRVRVVARAVDVCAYAGERKLSLETAGRQLRLAALVEMAGEQGCTWVATGHQKNDNAETVIHRLRRGTGFRGLAGIRPRRLLGEELWLARPLLSVTRDEIVRYLERRKLPWREDHTNADLAYTRNIIRHRLLPALQQESRHGLVAELSDLAASAGRLYDRIEREAEEARKRLVRLAVTQAALEAPQLASLPEMVAIELVRQILADLGCGEQHLSRQHYQSILCLARQRGVGKSMSLPGGFVARREQKEIVIGPFKPATARRVGLASPPSPPGLAPVIIPIPGRVRYADCEIDAQILERPGVELRTTRPDSGRFREYFDLDRLQQPVVVRPRRAGDRFHPLGLNSQKKVGKFLTTARVSRVQRARILIFADQEKIIWVCPVRIGEQAKVTNTTRRVLALKVTALHAPETPGPA